MWQRNNYNHSSAILKRAKYLLLLLSLIVIVANLYFLTATRQHAQSYSEQQNQATWFLFQLSKEFSELNSILPFAASSEDYYQKALLKYELTWSRFDLLLTSREADTYIAMPGARIFFSTLFSQFKSLEPRLELASHSDYTERVSKEFDVLYMSMIQYVNTNFRIKSPLYREQMQQARDLNDIQFASLLLLIVCVCLAMYIFHKESEYHKQLSLTDSLTGIANRLAMFSELNKRTQSEQPFSILLLDLNKFKQINDYHGHYAGDQVLKTVSRRLSRLGLECYRIGGDEFAVISDQIDLTHINKMTKTIHNKVFKPIKIKDGTRFELTTSIGIARYPEDSQQVAELLTHADISMYSDKRSNEIHAVINR
ncbi:GGDEF domain-containing protein [Vibrio brasiliensis]|uniref:Transcriptional regulator CdgA n=1 Tax=Vibrio brasiliensis LMG 20546 TaxID=945543 RepID=E8LXM3_9VIBR|nr:GGDEF domain-containing protein [Vibrio brasiliensis]EGA64634.1 transcriptional regulator CdgA [Vibrio brasiliensis LMG 20546]MCG9647817.1 GGDEF domain-containing protein [Vibrio brasiliensis]MCG9726612.1 GGDEF domain-containing protein [Vibrio brasiliensis]